MANAEHLKILKQGVEAWNQWRKSSDVSQPDLSGAMFCEEMLAGVNFENTNLLNADFDSATLANTNFDHALLDSVNFNRANLRCANFYCARLSRANLSWADLRDSNMSFTILSDAKLTKATLWGANFSNAHFERTTLDGARLAQTVLTNVDLRGASGIESAIHGGPSHIGFDTVTRSGGEISEEFLRGCGVPDRVIKFVRTNNTKGQKLCSCFISHSSKDIEFAIKLHGDLQKNGVRCWFAPEDLKIGDEFQRRITQAIEDQEKLLIVLSVNSLTSAWVEREVRIAKEREGKAGEPVLFPIRIDRAVMNTTQQWAYELRLNRHIGDFCDWKDANNYQKSFKRLLRDLRKA